MIDYKYDTLDDVVIKLHDLARIIEREIGVGELSQDVRKSADRLTQILKRDYNVTL
jgi:hypothetical protein